MTANNYYEILGVSKDASDDQIQRAYRKLARKYHPDVSKDKDADKKFKALNEAREVLKDPEKRKLYDTFGANWQQENERSRSQHRYGGQTEPRSNRHSHSFHFADNDFSGSADFSEILEDLFKKGAGEQNGYGRHTFDSPGKTTEAEITVTLNDVFHGITRMLTFQSYEPSPDGRLQPHTRTLQVKIPKGITDGAVIRLAGQGERGGGRGKAGDFLLHIRIAADARFKADGHDLYTVVAVTPWEAILGAAIPLETMDGIVTLSVPRGSQNGRRLRLRGKGLPKRNGSAGDIIVELEVQIPDHITREEERLNMEMAKTSKYNPRSKVAQKASNNTNG